MLGSCGWAVVLSFLQATSGEISLLPENSHTHVKLHSSRELLFGLCSSKSHSTSQKHNRTDSTCAASHQKKSFSPQKTKNQKPKNNSHTTNHNQQRATSTNQPLHLNRPTDRQTDYNLQPLQPADSNNNNNPRTHATLHEQQQQQSSIVVVVTVPIGSCGSQAPHSHTGGISAAAPPSHQSHRHYHAPPTPATPASINGGQHRRNVQH